MRAPILRATLAQPLYWSACAMAGADRSDAVRLELDNPVFQRDLFTLQKPERLAALDTFAKLFQLTWNQVYRDKGLRWEKIVSVKPPPGIDALYSLRITQSRRAATYRDGAFIRLLSIPPDHATYGRSRHLARIPRAVGQD